jgi:hypothetical protein
MSVTLPIPTPSLQHASEQICKDDVNGFSPLSHLAPGFPTWTSPEVESPGADHLAELPLSQGFLQNEVSAWELVLLVNLE